MDKFRRLFVSLANWQHFGLLVIVLASFILHLAVITNPPDQTIFDEVHYIEDARRINNEHRSERNEHPPLARLIIAKSALLIGDNAWGWRTVPVILSTLGLILFYDIARRLSKSNRLSFIATFLLAFENFYFIHGGMAMLDIYVLFFSILSFWCYLKGPLWWWASAVSGACAALSKFTGVMVFVTIGLHWLYAERETLIALVKAPFRRKALAERTELVSVEKVPYYRIPIFIFSMLLAPVAFILFYQVSDYFIWGRWQNVFQVLKTSLEQTNGIKFRGIEAIPPSSRPWEWLLSPTNSFTLYREVFSHVLGASRVVNYLWPPDGPHITGITSLSTFFVGLISIPFLLRQMTRKVIWMLVLTAWFLGVWLVPTLAAGRLTDTGASIISIGWFALIIPIIFVIKNRLPLNNTAAFALFWIVGAWLAWVPLSILTDRNSYSWYYLTAIPALCLGAALIIEMLVSKAANGQDKSWFNPGRKIVILFLFWHLASFAVLSPLTLRISVPLGILLLGFSLFYLRFSWQEIFRAVFSAAASALALRYVFYPQLEHWFGASTTLGNYPVNPSFWLAGSLLVSLMMVLLLFLVGFVFSRSRVALPAGFKTAP